MKDERRCMMPTHDVHSSVCTRMSSGYYYSMLICYLYGIAGVLTSLRELSCSFWRRLSSEADCDVITAFEMIMVGLDVHERMRELSKGDRLMSELEESDEFPTIVCLMSCYS